MLLNMDIHLDTHTIMVWDRRIMNIEELQNELELRVFPKTIAAGISKYQSRPATTVCHMAASYHKYTSSMCGIDVKDELLNCLEYELLAEIDVMVVQFLKVNCVGNVTTDAQPNVDVPKTNQFLISTEDVEGDDIYHHPYSTLRWSICGEKNIIEVNINDIQVELVDNRFRTQCRINIHKSKSWVQPTLAYYK